MFKTVDFNCACCGQFLTYAAIDANVHTCQSCLKDASEMYEIACDDIAHAKQDRYNGY